MSAGAVLADAARAAVAGWRDLLSLAGRSGWWPLAAAFAVGAYDAERDLTPALVIGAVWLTLPFGLLRNGFRELETPAATPALAPEAVRLAIAVANLPFLVALVLLGGPAVGLVCLVMVGLAWLLAVPRLAVADRPGIDVAAAGALPALAALAGLLLADRPPTQVPWLAVIALWAWASGLIALAAIRGPVTGGGAAAARGTLAALGTPGTAWLALAYLGVAAALTALLGPLGVLAAISLSAYLLLPPMVLTAAPDRAASAAAAAIHELPGLHVLVGAWLWIVLLQHWDLVDWRPFDVAVSGSAALAGYVLANVIAIRLATRRPRAHARHEVDLVPSVAIIVPCLDAALDLPTALAALRSQTHADFAVLVVDAGSTDGSAEEAAAWLGADGVIVAPPRPAGWTARGWACQVGAERTSSDVLLFVDPDTVLAPVAVRRLTELLWGRGLALLSGVTRFAMPTAGEQAGVPGFGLLLFGFVPIWWSALSGGRPARTAFAYERLILVRRDAYLAAGGHGIAGPDERDGPALARAVAGTGGRIGIVHLADLAGTRLARDLDAAVRSWRRIVGAVGTPLAATLAAMLLEIGAFIVPLILPAAALLGDVDPEGIAVASVPLLVLILARSALALTQRQPLTSILWHPVTAIVTLVAQAAGIRDHVVRRRT